MQAKRVSDTVTARNVSHHPLTVDAKYVYVFYSATYTLLWKHKQKRDFSINRALKAEILKFLKVRFS